MWISTKERLPEEYSRVLIYKTDNALMCYGVCMFIDGKFRFDATTLNEYPIWEKVADKQIHNVEKWMLIPPTK